MGNMDIKDEASIINSDKNVVSDVEQAEMIHIPYIRMPK